MVGSSLVSSLSGGREDKVGGSSTGPATVTFFLAVRFVKLGLLRGFLVVENLGLQAAQRYCDVEL